MNKALYHKIKYHQILMMSKRGYILSDLESRILNGSIEESITLFDDYYVKRSINTNQSIESLLDNVYTKSTGETIKVIYVESDIDDKQIKKEIFEPLKKRIMADTTNRNIIFISRVKWTSDGYKEFRGYPIFNIQYILYRELIYDPTSHIFQPQFKILSDDERKKLVTKLGQQGTTVLHRFCIDDPIVRFLGARQGQIISILRTVDHLSEVDKNLDYRIVVDSFIFDDKNPKENKPPT